MVEFYIDNPNCLILCVLPANVDIANSDALKLARKIDPEGNRTIGVVTKLDIMEGGTSAIDLLEGRVYPLKLGMPKNSFFRLPWNCLQRLELN